MRKYINILEDSSNSNYGVQEGSEFGAKYHEKFRDDDYTKELKRGLLFKNVFYYFKF
jgi:hypothetical protein